MTCRSCDPDPDRFLGDIECIKGTVFGYCSSSHCGGLCEPYHLCNCECHKESDR